VLSPEAALAAACIHLARCDAAVISKKHISLVRIGAHCAVSGQWSGTSRTRHCNETLDAHRCHMGTAIQHPVPDRVKPSLVIFDIQALYRSDMSVRVPGCQKLQLSA